MESRLLQYSSSAVVATGYYGEVGYSKTAHYLYRQTHLTLTPDGGIFDRPIEDSRPCGREKDKVSGTVMNRVLIDADYMQKPFPDSGICATFPWNLFSVSLGLWKAGKPRSLHRSLGESKKNPKSTI